MNLHSLLNVTLLVVLLSFPVVLEINKRYVKGKNKRFNDLIKNGRKLHPIVGGALILSGALHGYLKLGGKLMFHTGSLLLMLLLANGVVGFIYKKKHIKNLAWMHRIIGIFILLAFLIHYLKPWLFI